MNEALFFADVIVPERRCSSDIVTREISFAAGLDYSSTSKDTLADLDLDRTSVLSAEIEARLFVEMNRSYERASRLRDEHLAAPDGFDLDDFCHELARGDEIRNRLVVIFHKLTVSIAKNFVNSRHSLEELASEGDATLLRAVSLFDPSRGFRFSTYATYAVRRRLARYVTSLEHTHATPVDFSDSPPIPDQRRWTLPYQQSMDEGCEWLEVALYELSQRERYIIRCRFGWGREFETRTLQEIADELGVSRERVRQLELRAIQKLRDLATKFDSAMF